MKVPRIFNYRVNYDIRRPNIINNIGDVQICVNENVNSKSQRVCEREPNVKNFIPKFRKSPSLYTSSHCNTRLEEKIKNIMYEVMTREIISPILLSSNLSITKVSLNESRSLCRLYWSLNQEAAEHGCEKNQTIQHINRSLQYFLPILSHHLNRRLKLREPPMICFQQMPIYPT